MQRRDFLIAWSGWLATARRAAATPAAELRFGHRQANMVNEPGPGVFDLARRIPGLSGVQLQVYFKGTTLCDADTRAGYQRGAAQAGLQLPSIAGIWPPGAALVGAQAEEHIRKSIAVAAALRSRVILVAAFEKNCPSMDQEQSYAPVVAMLQKVAPAAADAGVILGMETSLSPADDRKLVDLVKHPNVRTYYDLDNVERYGHKNEAVPGIGLLGKARICEVHLKNEHKLLEEPGRVDWAAAVEGLARIGYAGWFFFESAHSGPEQCIEATRKNIEFVRRHFRA